MESQHHQKIVNMSYLALAALVAYIVLSGMMELSDMYDLESKVKSIEFIVRGFSVLAGLAVFIALNRHEKVNEFMNEVASELMTKVTWPTSKDTTSATIVVMITVVLAGMTLAAFDWFWVTILKWVI